jgi:hypothetical protein
MPCGVREGPAAECGAVDSKNLLTDSRCLYIMFMYDIDNINSIRRRGNRCFSI